MRRSVGRRALQTSKTSETSQSTKCAAERKAVFSSRVEGRLMLREHVWQEGVVKIGGSSSNDIVTKEQERKFRKAIRGGDRCLVNWRSPRAESATSRAMESSRDGEKGTLLRGAFCSARCTRERKNEFVVYQPCPRELQKMKNRGRGGVQLWSSRVQDINNPAVKG